ncbi:hypothetical protein CYMTET_16709 [Cymbomonas tetramitiformis]|uniref:Trichohyalin-plectin-homology domain-containing protein n=1 Tax=Cymbomonas tetramitiformis TaxID=36881 RepID=A0AAE0GBY9_9CHLO|nr:hypothetical protein CYMTET_16709 [Cymbomonas tetramitiformis]
MCKSVGASSSEAKRLIAKEVLLFMREQRTQVTAKDVTVLEAKLRGAVTVAPMSSASWPQTGGCSLPAAARVPRENCLPPPRTAELNMTAVPLPLSPPKIGGPVVKVFRGRSLGDIQRAKMNDPWAHMAKYKDQQHLQEQQQWRQKQRCEKECLKQELDGQMRELHLQRQAEAEEAMADFKREQKAFEQFQDEERERQIKKRDLVQQLMEERKEQMALLTKRRHKQHLRREQEKTEFNEAAALQQEDYDNAVAVQKMADKEMMKHYVAESAASEKIKEELKRKEVEFDANCDIEWAKRLEKAELDRKQFRENMKRSQEEGIIRSQKSLASFEGLPNRHRTDEKQEFFAKEREKVAEKEENNKLARKKQQREELRGTLSKQVQERQVQQNQKHEEKIKWREHFIEEDAAVQREMETRKLDRSMKKNKWVSELDHQVKRLYHETSNARYMSEAEERLNTHHPVVQSYVALNTTC